MNPDARLVWVDEKFLLEREVGEWMELPLWVVDAEMAGLLRSRLVARDRRRPHVPPARGDDPRRARRGGADRERRHEAGAGGRAARGVGVVSIRRVTFVHRETVRFRDLDSLGHMNNAVYATFVEQARIAFLSPHGADVENMILARLEIDFRSPVELGETVEIAVTPTRVGTKSFDLEYVLRAGDRVVAEAKTVLVAYDYAQARSVEIPDEWKERLAA